MNCAADDELPKFRLDCVYEFALAAANDRDLLSSPSLFCDADILRLYSYTAFDVLLLPPSDAVMNFVNA